MIRSRQKKIISHQLPSPPAMDISLITGVYDDCLSTRTAGDTKLSDTKGKGKEEISGKCFILPNMRTYLLDFLPI